MTDPARRAELEKISGFVGHRIIDLETQLAHLPLASLVDAAVICERSKWDLEGLGMMSLVIRPANGEYRIALVRRLTDINVDLLNPWNVAGFFKGDMGIDSLTIEDIDDDHVVWAAVAMLVAGATHQMYFGEDLSFLREPVEAAQEFLNERPEQKLSIREIIRSRRVYKPSEIEMLLTGGEPLHRGAL